MKNIILVFSLALNLFFSYQYFISRDVKESPVATTDEAVQIEGKQKEEVNIVMLGNSITYQGNWEEVLKREDVLNGGKPGWTSQQISWVIKDYIIPYEPKICFFKAGTNDLTLRVPVDRVYENMCMILDSVKAVGTIPVFTTTLYQLRSPGRNKIYDQLNDRMAAFCNERGYDFMDIRPFLCKDGNIIPDYVVEDGTHLRPQAYPEWAKAIKPILKKYGI